MKIDISKLKTKNGYLEGQITSLEKNLADKAQNYKKRISAGFTPITPNQIQDKLNSDEYFVTKKIDGELGILFFDGNNAVLSNRSGLARAGIGCIDEAAELLKNSDFKSITLACELHTDESEQKSRVSTTRSALGCKGNIESLHLSFFDILEIDEEIYTPENYLKTHSKLVELFNNAEKVFAVQMKKVESKNDVLDIYNTWIESEKAEGLIIHSTMPQVFKVKPKRHIDAAIIGYTEGDGENVGKVREILLALMKDDDSLLHIGKTGNGFSEKQKKEYFNILSKKHIESDYIETDSRNIAFHMLKPELVAEITAIDILSENSKGIIKRPSLTASVENINFKNLQPSISLISPVFERIREDKTAEISDINFSQVSEVIDEKKSSEKDAELEKSEVILREVYKKESKGSLMVQKFLVWKSNKNTVDSRFPAYVIHYTNFSATRKDPLKRELKVSSCKEQILEMTKNMVEKNVKKGWLKV